MSKRLLILFFAFCFSIFNFQIKAQNTVYKVAVFAPIYLDSAFEGENFRGDNSIKKVIFPGLDFYNGVNLALDSLKSEGVSLEVFIYDSKSSTQPVANILQKDEMQHMSLIIAAFNSKLEIKQIADYAETNHIPLVSATFPNDGGITNHSHFVLLNSTLRTHCEELYKFIQKNYATTNILFFRRKGSVEDVIQSYFSEAARSTLSVQLKYKTVELSDTFTVKQLQQFLDSNKNNLAVCASINDAFTLRMMKALNASRGNYSTTMIAMPTIEGLRIPEATIGEKNIDYIYSTPYYFLKPEALNKSFTDKFQMQYNAKPSDMAFKGFETMYHFSHLLLQYGNTEMMKHLSDKSYKVFNDFDIRPVKNKPNFLQTDYFENRKLYFIKKSGNTIKAIY